MSLPIRFRRAASVVAGAFIGLAVAAPAGATTPAEDYTASLTATSSCTDGGWATIWSLTTAETKGHDGVLGNVKASVAGFRMPPPSRDGEHVPTIPPPRAPMLTTFVDDATIAPDGSLTENHQFGSSFWAVRLSLTVTWRDGETSHTRNLLAEAHRPDDCVVGQPTTTAPPPARPDATADSEPTATPTSSAPAPAGAAAGAGGGGLPVTGAAAGTVAGAAALLLATGTVLLVVTRRRRARFTA